MESLKLADCENRLKQTELHLQGELSRVSPLDLTARVEVD